MTKITVVWPVSLSIDLKYMKEKAIQIGRKGTQTSTQMGGGMQNKMYLDAISIVARNVVNLKMKSGESLMFITSNQCGSSKIKQMHIQKITSYVYVDNATIK